MVSQTDAGFRQSTDRDLSTVVFEDVCGGQDTAVVIISKAFDFLVHLRYPLGARFSNAHTHKDAQCHAHSNSHNAAHTRSLAGRIMVWLAL